MADYKLAGTGRTAARDLCLRYQRPGHTLWFEGHWGFQYYMEQRGAQALDSHLALPRPGDTVVVPSEAANTFDISTNLVRLVDTMEYQSGRYLATMNQGLSAGFYAATAGPFPFSAGDVEPERYYVFEVTHARDSAPNPWLAPFESGAVGQQFDLRRNAAARRGR
jgi:hypothetical protein